MTNPSFPDIKMDALSLYKEEVVTDQKVGTIRIMTPILSQTARLTPSQSQFVGQAQMMTPQGTHLCRLI